MVLNYFNNKLILNKQLTEEKMNTNIDAEKAITRS